MEVIAAKVVIYAEERTNIMPNTTPEVYNALKDWIDFRAKLSI